jgi:hypothetical protein
LSGTGGKMMIRIALVWQRLRTFNAIMATLGGRA